MGEDRHLVHGYGCRTVSGCGGAFTDRCGARHRAGKRHRHGSIATANHATRSREVVWPSTTAISASSEATDARARTATCHRKPSSFLPRSPGLASRRCWRSCRDNKNADDPLFRPVDADDFRVNGDKATDFSNLVENGLVRVTMPLPPNVRLIDSTCATPIRCSAQRLMRRSSISGERSCRCTTSRSPVPMACRQSGRQCLVSRSWASSPTDRIFRAATSTMRGSGRCRNKHVERSSRTRRSRSSRRPHARRSRDLPTDTVLVAWR